MLFTERKHTSTFCFCAPAHMCYNMLYMLYVLYMLYMLQPQNVSVQHNPQSDLQNSRQPLTIKNKRSLDWQAQRQYKDNK